MADVPLALVRVQPGRLKTLKEIVSDCDRSIQLLDAGIFQANTNIEMAKILNALDRPEFRRWIKKLDLLRVKRAKIDEERRQARLELKGYGKPAKVLIE